MFNTRTHTFATQGRVQRPQGAPFVNMDDEMDEEIPVVFTVSGKTFELIDGQFTQGTRVTTVHARSQRCAAHALVWLASAGSWI